jgi:hypothetical protein
MLPLEQRPGDSAGPEGDSLARALGHLVVTTSAIWRRPPGRRTRSISWKTATPNAPRNQGQPQMPGTIAVHENCYRELEGRRPPID